MFTILLVYLLPNVCTLSYILARLDVYCATVREDGCEDDYGRTAERTLASAWSSVTRYENQRSMNEYYYYFAGRPRHVFVCYKIRCNCKPNKCDHYARKRDSANNLFLVSQNLVHRSFVQNDYGHNVKIYKAVDWMIFMNKKKKKRNTYY